VVADVAKLAAGREDYYTRELAADHEPYVSSHDATTSDIGHWTQRSVSDRDCPRTSPMRRYWRRSRCSWAPNLHA
jgi:hypothetical protein